MEVLDIPFDKGTGHLLGKKYHLETYWVGETQEKRRGQEDHYHQ